MDAIHTMLRDLSEITLAILLDDEDLRVPEGRDPMYWRAREAYEEGDLSAAAIRWAWENDIREEAA